MKESDKLEMMLDHGTKNFYENFSEKEDKEKYKDHYFLNTVIIDELFDENGNIK